MGEPFLVESRRQRQDARVVGGGDLHGDQVERDDVVEGEGVGASLADAFLRPTERFHHHDPAGTHAACRHQLGDGARRRLVPGEGKDARFRLEMRHDAIERAAMQRDQRAVLLWPAHPGAGHREGGELRDDPHLRGRDRPAQAVTDAVMEWVAGREHADLAAALPEDLRQGVAEGLRPGTQLARHGADQRDMPLAAEDDLSLLERDQRLAAQARRAVLAEADQREPGRILPARQRIRFT